MRFIGLTEGLRMTKEKLPAVISVISVVLLCLLSFIGISALLEADAAAAMDKHEQEITDLIESSSQITDNLATAIETSQDATTTTAITTTSATTESSGATTTTAATSASTSTTTSSSTEATTTTAATQGTTETTVGEKTYNAIVYATKTVNLRKGPGTQYESIRLLHRGDQIDVIGVTTNGWYKTIKGNYVIASCTQSKKINTPTPTPKPATPTPKAKTTKTPTKAPTPTNRPAPDKDKMTLVGEYKITFYIPFQGTKTASGTTCTMGRTIAASKNDFPFGTVLYIENDPLGGDGYYTVEDRGVSSGKIDIFVNTMKDVPSYGRTTRKVYIVNK